MERQKLQSHKIWGVFLPFSIFSIITMDRSFPTRKNYEYELPTIYGSVILRFAQASSAETKNDYTQFSSLTDELFADRFITLLKSRTVGYAKKRYVPSYKLRKAIRQDIVIVFHEIAKLRYV